MLNGQWLHVIRPLSSITRSEDVVIFTYKYVYIYINSEKMLEVNCGAPEFIPSF